MEVHQQSSHNQKRERVCQVLQEIGFPLTTNIVGQIVKEYMYLTSTAREKSIHRLDTWTLLVARVPEVMAGPPPVEA